MISDINYGKYKAFKEKAHRKETFARELVPTNLRIEYKQNDLRNSWHYSTRWPDGLASAVSQPIKSELHSIINIKI